MSSTEAPRPARARAPREVEEQTRRRRRDPNDTSVVKRLAVPENRLNREQYQYRWVNDTPGRIEMLTNQDWDLVSDDELGPGYTNARHGDVAQNRVALTTRLMRKPKEFFEEDHTVRQKRIDAEMRAAELGRKVLNGPDEGLDAQDKSVYQPGITRDGVSTNKL